MKELLVIIDMQNDFVTGSLMNSDIQKMVPKLVKKLDKSYKDFMFTMDTHEDNYLETQEGKMLPVKHCIKNTEGWKIIPELTPFVQSDKCKAIMEKSGFGAVTLINLAKDYDTIEVVGVCTDICVVSTALLLKTIFTEKPIYLDKKCCVGTSKKAHNAAVNVMKSCQIIVN